MKLPLLAVLALLPTAAVPPAPVVDELDIRVTVTGGAHAGVYQGSSSTPCAELPGEFVVGYMPAVVEQGLRSFRLVVREPSTGGTSDFELTFSLAQRHRVVATYMLNPAGGSGSGTARLTRAAGATTVDVSGATAEGVRVSVRARCASDEAATVADASEPAVEPEARVAAAATLAAARLLPIVDDRAPSLAERTFVKGAMGHEALREAIRWSGIGIRDESGAVVATPYVRAQGIAFDAMDVALMERSLQSEMKVPLGLVAEGLAAASPRLRGSELARLIVQDLRKHAQGSDPALRFWARFIAGRGGDERAAFAGNPDSLMLDPVQLAFVMRRLEADFELERRKAAGTQTGMRTPRRQSGVALATRAPPLPMLSARAACKLSDAEATGMDWGAVAITYGFGLAAGAVAEAVPAAASLQSFTSNASFAFAMAKIVAMLAGMDAETVLTGEGPLVRTHLATVDGDFRRLETKLRLPRINDQVKVLNCLRPVFNQVGLDFTIPDGGPVKEASVQYAIVAGGTQVLNTASGHLENAIINFAPGANPLKGNVTDAEGRTGIRIMGLRQKETIPEPRAPIDLEGAVRASVQLTRPSLFKDLPNVVGTATAGAFAPVAIIPELLARMHIPLSTAVFPVRDWVNGRVVTLTATGIEGGNLVCPDDMGLGTDVIQGTIMMGDTEGAAVRTTSMPICGGRPVKYACEPHEDCEFRWDGAEKECAILLNGRQELILSMRVEEDPQEGEVLSVRWELPDRAASRASATGDCLKSRWGNEFEPDNEFIVETREEAEAHYNGFRLGLGQRTPLWVGYEDGARFKLPPGNLQPPFRLESIGTAYGSKHGVGIPWVLEVR